jgi:tRNA G18 (ribose-2'-O)-methylase SpoU
VLVHRITDPDDPIAAPFRSIPTYDRRDDAETFVVESRQCVRRLIEGARFPVRAVLSTPPALRALAPLLAQVSPPPIVCEAEEPVVQAVTGFRFHRGCLAIGERGPALTPADLLAHAATLVVLDAVSDPDNVGAIFRTALAFGADGILLSPAAGDPFYRKATRVAVGATLVLPFARSHDLAHDLALLRAAGFALLALTPDGEPIVRERGIDTGPRRALLVGAEGDGLGPIARAAADRQVAIPLAPAVDSLNVATATGIALWALAGGES